MLSHGLIGLADERREPAEGDPLVEAHRKRFDALRRRELRPSREPRVQCCLVEQQLPPPAPLLSRLKCPDRLREIGHPAPVLADVVVGTPLPRSPQSQRGQPGRKLGAGGCGCHPSMIGAIGRGCSAPLPVRVRFGSGTADVCHPLRAGSSAVHPLRPRQTARPPREIRDGLEGLAGHSIAKTRSWMKRYWSWSWTA